MTKKTKIAILISGRGSNMQAISKACENQNFPAEIVLVLSNKPNAEGLKFAQEKGIKTAIVNHQDFSLTADQKKSEKAEHLFKIARENFDKKMSAEIEKSGAEFICLAGFMRLLSPWFVERWFDKLINIHPSLLPNFKGADAVGDAIKAGAKKSGCTVHFVREEMDSGPIILQAEVEVTKDDNKESLAAKILQKEHQIYPQALQKILQ